MEKCIKLNDELGLVEFIANEAWLWAKERITQLQLDNSSLGNALALEHELAVRFSSFHDEAVSKLSRYEAAETWHQVTAGEGELPPKGVEVIGRFGEHSGVFIVKVRPKNQKPYDGINTYQWRFVSSEDVPQ